MFNYSSSRLFGIWRSGVWRLLALAVTGPALHAADADSIKIGEYGAFSGKEAAFGVSARKGAILAFEEANAAGGVLGRKVELLTEDNQ